MFNFIQPFYEVGQTGWVDNARYICETNCQAQNDALPNPDPVLSNMCAFDCGIHGDCVEGKTYSGVTNWLSIFC